MFKRIKKAKDTGGFSLLEIVITIIIIGLALSAIAESFIVGSARNVDIIQLENFKNHNLFCLQKYSAFSFFN